MARIRTGRLLLVAPLIVLAIATMVFVAHRTNNTSSEIDDLRAELSTIKQRNALSPVVIREVHTETNPQSPPAALALPEASAASVKSKGLSLLEREQDLKLINESRAEVCEKAFAGEAPDPAWSDTAAQIIRKKYSGQEFQSLTISTACRSTLCKIDFTYSDSMAGPMAVQAMTFAHPWPAQLFTRFDQETKTGVSYLAREGTTLPSPNVPPQH